MPLDNTIIDRLAAIQWFAHCGDSITPDRTFLYSRVPHRTTAVEGAISLEWRAARVEALGDLTSYLAIHHSDAFQQWNDLVSVATDVINSRIVPLMAPRLAEFEFGRLADTIALDLVRIAMYATYKKQFKRARARLLLHAAKSLRGRPFALWLARQYRRMAQWESSHLLSRA